MPFVIEKLIIHPTFLNLAQLGAIMKTFFEKDGVIVLSLGVLRDFILHIQFPSYPPLLFLHQKQCHEIVVVLEHQGPLIYFYF